MSEDAPRPGEREAPRASLQREVPCHACGAPMVFVETASGKSLPLSVRTLRSAPCPECTVLDASGRKPIVRLARCPRCSSTGEVHLLLPHFADCPEAGSFRKKKPTR